MQTGQTYVAPDGIHFGTEKAEFDYYNFQPQETIQEIIDFVHTPCPEGHLFELRGPENIGKEYLLRSAAYLGSEQGKPTLCTVLQLPQGWNPDKSSDTNRFIENLKVTHPYLHDPSYSARLERIKKTFQNHQNSIVNAVAITLTATMGIPDLLGSSALSSILSFWREAGAESHLTFPEEQQFFRFLQRLTETHRLLFYVPDGGLKCLTVFQWALDHLLQLPNLAIAVGLAPRDPAPHYRNHSPKTLYLSPYQGSEIAELLNRKLKKTNLDPMFIQAFAKHTSGYPGSIAIFFAECIHKDLIIETEDGHWHINTDSKTLTTLSTIFSQGELLGPIKKYRKTLLDSSATNYCHVLDDFLRTAAACGEFIPFDIITDFLEIPQEDQDWLEDRLTDELQGSFIYRGLTLKDFPNTEVYQLTNPWISLTIQQALGKELSLQIAKKLALYLSIQLRPTSERMARLFASVFRAAGEEQELDQTNKLLSWWTEQWNATALKQTLISQLQGKSLHPESLWKIINITKKTWPPWRRVMLLDAYAEQPQGLPKEHLIPWLLEMGSCLYDLGKYEEAVGKLEEAETIQRAALSPGHPRLAITLSSLGNCLYFLNRLEEAMGKLEEAETIQRTALSAGHPELAVTLSSLGNCLNALNRLEEAMGKLEEAETIERAALPPGHPRLAITLSSLGNCLYFLNRLEEAVGKYEEAETIQRAALPLGHPGLAATLSSLGNCLYFLNRLEEAMGKLEEAETIQRAALPLGHPGLAVTLSTLGNCLNALNRLEEAMGKLEEAETIERAALSPGHPRLAITLSNLGSCLYLLNRLEEAVGKLEEAETIQRAALPLGHRELAVTLNNLGNCLYFLNRPEEAVRKLEEAETIQRAALSPGHPELAVTLSSLGNCLYLLNQLEEAVRKLDEAKKTFELHTTRFSAWIQSIDETIAKIKQKN